MYVCMYFLSFLFLFVTSSKSSITVSFHGIVFVVVVVQSKARPGVYITPKTNLYN